VSHFAGCQHSKNILDSLLQIVRQKRLNESQADAKATQGTGFLGAIRKLAELRDEPKADTKGTKDTDFTETIRKLAELRDEGILTQEEFEEKKNKILQDSE